MIDTHVEFEVLKSQLLYRRVISWSERQLVLDNGLTLEIIDDSDANDKYCTGSGGYFIDVTLDAVITDVELNDVVTSFNQENYDLGGTFFTKEVIVTVLSNKDLIAHGVCHADNGDGGYYCGASALKIDHKIFQVVSAKPHEGDPEY